MRAASWLVSLILLAGPIGPAIAGDEQEDLAAFEQSVVEYRAFTTPRCAPEMVQPYNILNRLRDAAFRESLAGTALAAAHKRAVQEQTRRERHRVTHCSGPSPAPGTSLAAADPRTRAITDAQADLRRQAADLPDYFNEADEHFMKMTRLRDELVGTKEL